MAIKLGELRLLSDEDRRRILYDWNQTAADYPNDACLHQLIEVQVRKTPDTEAVVCGDERLTYAELDASADRVSHTLAALGVGVESVVGLLVTRSVATVVGALGILKAGGAYLPLEPEFPIERLQFMVKDAGANVIVTVNEHAAIAADLGVRVCSLSDRQIASGSPAPPPSTAGPENAAYVMYTSGSTGRPKGVVNVHRGVVNRIEWMRRAFDVSSRDRILHKTSFGFDVSVWELFLPLLAGGTLVIALPGEHRDVPALVARIERDRVTCMHFVPTMMGAFLDAADLSGCRSLRVVFSSGEALSASLRNSFFPRLDCRLVNLYGPTEASIDVTVWECHASDTGTTVPLGRPISNIHVYVLNERREPVPVGVLGELFLGGVGVARGYVNQPALTAERFLDDPFVPGDRMYRTGDLGKFASDGTIEFLGRRDDQVKIRGFRIELGEIEVVLREHPDVRDAVVLAHTDEGRAPRLLAYVVPRAQGQASGADQTVESIREHLRGRLPDYMRPSMVTVVDDLPYTATGKVDRKRLLALGTVPRTSPDSYVAPATAEEAALADIWRGLLGLNVVGTRTNFFEMGGDSILSIQLVARARQQGLALKVRDVFDAPTIQELARRTTRIDTSTLDQPAAPGTPEQLRERRLYGDDAIAGLPVDQVRALMARLGDVTDLYPLSPMQEGLLFRALFLPESDSYLNQNVLEIEGALDEAALRRAWEVVTDHYEILRTGFVWDGLPQPLQFVARSIPIQWASSDWSAAPPETHRSWLDDLMRAHRKQPFDLSQPGAFRLHCVRVAPARWYLLWEHHHILIDGWCLSLIWGAVFRAYEQCAAGERVHLAPTRPYRDYIAWLRRQQPEAAESFWRAYLQGFETPTRFSRTDNYLPTDKVTRVVRLSEEETSELKGIARRHQATVNTIVQSVWALLLARYSGCRDVVFGASVAGRPADMTGVEQMVGIFINTLPVRVRLHEVQTVGELMRRIHRELVAVNDHAYLPLAQIKSLSPAGLGGQHLFDSLIAFENYPEDALPPEQVAGLRVRDSFAQERTEYPLGMIVLPERQLEFHFEYDAAILAEWEEDSLIEQYLVMLRRIIADPDAPIAEIESISSDIQQRVVEEWNRTERQIRPGTVTDWVLAMAEAQPAAVALVTDGECWDYARVSAEAQRMAAELTAVGVRRGDVVAVRLERSPYLVPTVLGIWLAGAIYCPVDPGLPVPRQAAIVDDADPSAIVVDQERPAPAVGFNGPVVECAKRRDTQQSVVVGAAQSSADVPAYLLYTSGSTGQPKGVVCGHAGLANRVDWSIPAYGLGPDTVLLHNAAPGFDISLWEMLAPLAAGGRVVILPAGQERDVRALLDAIAGEAVTLVHLVPSLLFVMLDAAAARTKCASLRGIITGGDVVPVAARNVCAVQVPGARLYHAYGPTETTISVTHWQCEVGQHEGRVPLGHPIANTRIYVLDAARQPVPVGVAGELWVGGVQVGLGYWRDPALTADRFIASPFVLEDRLYRTGDWARWTADGLLEYIGRMDRQVKIRGQRVELAEVEAVLHRVTGVSQAVVECRPAPNGEPQLIAWVRRDHEASAGADEETRVIRAVGQTLPAHMVPTRVLIVDTFPLTTSGKIERSALRVPDAAGGARARSPRNDIERRVHEIWCQLLKRDQIDIEADFFALGGHSLLAIRLVVNVEKAFGPGAINVTTIFKRPTIAALAAALAEPDRNLGSPLQLLSATADKPALILVHPAEGLGHVYRALADRLPTFSVWSIDNPHLGDGDGRFASVEAMADCYAALIESAALADGAVVGGWSFGGVVALEMARRLQSDGHEVRAVVLLDSYYLPALGLPFAGDAGDTPLERARFHAGSLTSRFFPDRYDGRVILLKATDGEAEWAGLEVDRHNGWSHIVTEQWECQRIPGAHATLLGAVHVDTTAEAMGAVLSAIGSARR